MRKFALLRNSKKHKHNLFVFFFSHHYSPELLGELIRGHFQSTLISSMEYFCVSNWIFYTLGSKRFPKRQRIHLWNTWIMIFNYLNECLYMGCPCIQSRLSIQIRQHKKLIIISSSCFGKFAWYLKKEIRWEMCK